jgi:hypothetical protein
MSDILADYREWRDAQPGALKTHSDRCHMWHRDCMIHRLAATLERARLTDEEREAIKESIQFAFPASHPTATTLRKLLERLD